jgi:hypothetical protein
MMTTTKTLTETQIADQPTRSEVEAARQAIVDSLTVAHRSGCPYHAEPIGPGQFCLICGAH